VPTTEYFLRFQPGGRLVDASWHMPDGPENLRNRGSPLDGVGCPLSQSFRVLKNINWYLVE
jgi:hypothetical protein